MMYKKAVASFWSPEEVDLSQDQRDWDSLNSEWASFASGSLQLAMLQTTSHAEPAACRG